MNKIPLQKFIADSGYCSRRRAEEIIKKSVQGSSYTVLVNGASVGPGVKVGKNDDVRVNGKKIELPGKDVYIKLNKPEGYTCTTRRFKNEKNVLDLIREDDKGKKVLKENRIFIVGRLDKNSRGLVLLTGDGELGNRLTHPSFGHRKIYEATIKENKFDPEEIENRFRQGVNIKEETGMVWAESVKKIANKKFEIVLSQGRKRQIRRMFEALDLTVVDLVRIGIDGLRLGGLKEGEWRHLTPEEVDKLKNN
jgi:pseudouridine synthase